jgi:SWI/SNF-related matrix-associated actin-dependent regulator of chromatin subfamily A member 5
MGVKGPFLVICPLSVVPAWMNEIARWTPSFKAIKFHGPPPERERLKRLCNENSYDVYVTNNEQFVNERHWFQHRVWKYVVVDEGCAPPIDTRDLTVGHCLKNDKTDLARFVGTLSTEYRLLLTGTPLQKYVNVLPLKLTVLSSLHELWALFHFLYPDVFPSATADAFKAAFNLTKGTYDTKFIDAASSLLSKLMLRRMKTDMNEIKLPPKEELLIYVPLSRLQRYTSIPTVILTADFGISV